MHGFISTSQIFASRMSAFERPQVIQERCGLPLDLIY